MIRTGIVAAAVALVFSVTVALSFQEDLPPVQVGIDLTTEGNTGSVLGAVDSCLTVNQGDTFDVDVTVKGVPPISSDFNFGLAAFGINLHFDPDVVQVTGVNNKMIIQSTSAFEFIAGNYEVGGDANPFPGTSGNSRVDYVDLARQDASGDGVLARFTLEAVGAGSTLLTLDSELEGTPYPVTLGRMGADLLIYPVTNLQNGRVTVGEPCTDPPPAIDPTTPTPPPETAGPSPTPAPSVSRVPADDTELAVDAVITGNEAAKVDEIDACARADTGTTFQVDVVIQGVQDLLAWELPVTFDPQVLRVVDRDVKLFLQANSGSQVLDASNQTPDSTGIYVTGAFDSADPVTPDSGDGVLVRLTLEALRDGTSKLSIRPASIDGDQTPDRGILLRNIDSAIIGDTNGDTFFDGPSTETEIRVGADCAAGGHVVVVSEDGESPGPGGNGSDDDSNAWIWVAIGAGVVAVVAAAGAGLLLLRRRGRSTTL